MAGGRLSKVRRCARGDVNTLSRSNGLLDELFGEDMHAQRLVSLKNAVIGVVESGELCLHAIGRGLAAVKGLADKHAVKQVDRLIGNERLDTEALQAIWVGHVLSDSKEVLVNLDWTEFDKDNQSMLVLSLQLPSRALPLVWKSVHKREIKGCRNALEDALLVRFKAVVPEGMSITLVADRGFSDQKLYTFLSQELGFDFIIRFRGVVHVTDAKGKTHVAKELVGPGGRLRALRGASVTQEHTPVATVVVVHEKGMKDAWCLASSRGDWTGSRIKKAYGGRFSCEETFRDLKDMRFGLGMKWQRITQTARRDRLMLLAVLALHLLTLLGAAGEQAGLDRFLKTNTSKRRQLSLVRQGQRWYQLIPNMPDERLLALVAAYETILKHDAVAQALAAA